MLKVIVTICAALLLFGCSSSTSDTLDATRESSKAYYRFHVVDSEPTASNIYYTFPENQTWGSFSVYRVIEPIEDIDCYDEFVIEGKGPDGNGRFVMRVVTDQEQIAEYSWDFFLVSGM
ncbi:MAG: hypothetical protein H7A35_06640 [Planctomycetales bacterium]|nr:hypothetical protein [bacterium]UNM09733.1 MAG: hypothetical protein H7A35_06640 [Planctomycetales bacterium]